MKRILIILVCVLSLVLLTDEGGNRSYVYADSGREADKEICITFDDLPVVRVHDRIERLMITDEILFTLEEFGVIAAGFVVGNNIEGDFDILESWLEAGHTLGSHTYSHPDLNDVPTELYISDIKKGNDTIEDLLTAAKQLNRYFRYPGLHYGNTYDIKIEVADYLDKQDYRVAHVSIDTDDFAYNLQFEKINKLGDSIKFVQLGDEYLDHIMERVEEAEKIAADLLGRPVRHILLLHANRINSAFLADLLSEISAQGYSFISLEKALIDPIYSMPDSYVGPKGLSVLEKLAKSDPDLLPAHEGR